jgi:5-methyltetrahydropteroyltriglutamate--homocysteine methyltransferase
MIATLVGGQLSEPPEASSGAAAPTARVAATLAVQERAGLDLLAIAVGDTARPPDPDTAVGIWRAASACTARPVKAVLPGPLSGAVAAGAAGAPLAGAVAAWARAVNAAARALAAAGAPWVEIDEPALVTRPADWPLAREALAAVAAEVAAPFALVTWGGDVVGRDGLFQLPFHLFGLDLVAGPRNWTLVDTFPRGPSLGLGIVDARTPALEYAASLGNVLWRAMQVIAPRRLHVHPSAPLDRLAPAEAEAKLALVAQIVREARPRAG